MSQILFVGLIGLGVFLLGVFKVRKLRASQSWAIAMGTIVESSVEESFNRGSDDLPDSWSYTPVIRYQFLAQGQTIVGDRPGFDRKSYSKMPDARAVVARYPLGAQVNVFFDPEKPADSVLHRTSGSAWVFVVVGLAAFLLAVAAAMKK
jgi:hypothetical protein